VSCCIAVDGTEQQFANSIKALAAATAEARALVASRQAKSWPPAGLRSPRLQPAPGEPCEPSTVRAVPVLPAPGVVPARELVMRARNASIKVPGHPGHPNLWASLTRRCHPH